MSGETTGRRFWRKWLAFDRKTARSRRLHGREKNVQHLEHRMLLSATLNADTGTLHVSGTPDRDHVLVQRAADDLLHVSVNSESSFWPASSVSQIVFAGHDGDDRFENFTVIPSHAAGGSGNDTLIGGSGDDTLVGNAGQDLLLGGDGDDVLGTEDRQLRTVRVTTLDPVGPGSLSEALSEGNRRIVFEVAGTIDLRAPSAVSLNNVLPIEHSNIEIAGDTAPSPGVTILGGRVLVRDAANVTIRHVKIRGGGIVNEDALSIFRSRDVLVQNVSLSWSLDELAEVWDGSRNVTFDQVLFAEPLNANNHAHGLLVGRGSQEVTVTRSVFTHLMKRGPKFAYGTPAEGGTSGLVVNSIIYNPETRAMMAGNQSHVAALGNLVIPGRDTNSSIGLLEVQSGVQAGTQVYLEDNHFLNADTVMQANAGRTEPLFTGPTTISSPEAADWNVSYRRGVGSIRGRVDPTAHDPEVLAPPDEWMRERLAEIDVLPADQVLDSVLATVGARFWERDEVDTRAVNDVLNRTGRIIDTVADVGGLPPIPVVAPGVSIAVEPDGDSLFGQDGDDVLFGSHGHDVLDGGSGNDQLSGREGNDTLEGESGNDTLHGGSGEDQLTGMTGTDVLSGGVGDDLGLWDAGDGADMFDGGIGSDAIQLAASDGDDIIQLLSPEDRLEVGVNGETVVIRDFERATIKGGAGADHYTTDDLQGFGSDFPTTSATGFALILAGEGGNDVIDTSAVRDPYMRIKASGGSGNDVVRLPSQVDQAPRTPELIKRALGGFGDDTLIGGATGERLVGGQGKDVFQGGGGEDIFSDEVITAGSTVVGAAPGQAPLVQVIDPASGGLIYSFEAFDSGYRGGVDVAVADIDGDGYDDIVASAGQGVSQVRVFSGRSGVEILRRTPFSGFNGDVTVAAGDVNGDGFADIIVAPGRGLEPRINIFSGSDGTLLNSFLAYNARLQSGIHVAAGDINGDGHVDIVTGPRAGGPHVRAFDGRAGGVLRNFFAFEKSYRGGVEVAVADTNGDGAQDIITGKASGNSPDVRSFSGRDSSLLLETRLNVASYPNGVRVAGVSTSGTRDNIAVLASGSNAAARILQGDTGHDAGVFPVSGAGSLTRSVQAAELPREVLDSAFVTFEEPPVDPEPISPAPPEVEEPPVTEEPVEEPPVAEPEPLTTTGISDHDAFEDTSLSFSVRDAFVDPAGRVLSFAAGLASGGTLPDWLAFDSATAAFSGTPSQLDVGDVMVRVIAHAENDSVETGFVLTVMATNDAPEIASSISNQTAVAHRSFLQSVDGVFTDVDGDVLTITVAGTPDWLSFDATANVLSGRPPVDSVGASFVVTVTATDASRVAVSDDFTLTVAPAPTLVAVGTNSRVKVFDAQTEQVIFDFVPYAGHSGGVNVVLGDINGDRVPDIITAPAVGGVPEIRVFDGESGEEVRRVAAYEASFRGGVNLSAGDVTGDGRLEFVVGPGPNAGHEVRVLDAASGAVIHSIRPFRRLIADVSVAAGDVNGDGYADVITAPAKRGGPHVRIFSGLDGRTIRNLFAFERSYRNGVRVSAADVNGDGLADIIATTADADARLRVFSASDRSLLASHDAGGTAGLVSSGRNFSAGHDANVLYYAPGDSGIRVYDSQRAQEIDQLFALSVSETVRSLSVID